MPGSPGFTVGGTLRRTFDIVVHDAVPLMALATLFYGLPSAVLGLITLCASLAPAAVVVHPPLPSVGVILSIGAIIFVVVFCGTILATAATVRLSYEGACGRPASVADGVLTAFRVFPVAISVSLMSGICVALASGLLVFPGIMLLCRWAVALPTLVIERTGILGSLARSRDLTRNHRWAILGFVFTMMLISGIALAIIGAGAGLVAGAVSGVAGAAFQGLLGLLVNTMTVALSGAWAAAMYFELRRVEDNAPTGETV